MVKTNGNGAKIVLDLCGGTGAWSKPYKEAGYDVRIITLPDFDIKDSYFIGKDFIFKNQTGGDSIIVKVSDIYGILAAPPCTEFSLAKSTKPREFVKGMEIVEACLKIIWQIRIKNKPAFWALENPRGFLRQFLGKPPYSIEMWGYGDLNTKKTDLWGYFNLPRQTMFIKPEGMTRVYPNGKTNNLLWSTAKVPAEYKHLKLKRADIRAITPAGFAQAFYLANK